MNKINITLGPVFLLATLGCESASQHKHGLDADTTPPKTAQLLSDQSYLVKLIQETGIADNERSLVHLSHTCNLMIDNQAYAVIDLRELMKGAVVPRGVNQIILLNTEHQLVNRIEYGNARPLFCENNKLYLYDNLTLDGHAEEGNVLQFDDSGFSISVTQEDLNNKLPL